MSDRWREVYLDRETARILSAVAVKNRAHANKMLLAGQKFKAKLAERGIKLGKRTGSQRGKSERGKGEKDMRGEGWACPSNAKKWHYFVNKKSLCDKWGIFVTVGLEQGNDDSPDNCVACQRKLLKRKEEASGVSGKP